MKIERAMDDQNRDFNDDAVLRLLRADIHDIPLLTREEEKTLSVQAKAGDQESLNRLVESNLKWVFKIAFDYWYPGLPLMDMISEGCIGLIIAAKRFDPETGFRLTTYSEKAIKRRITAFIVNYKKHRHSSLDEFAYKDEDGPTRKDLLESRDRQADELCFDSDIRSLLVRLSIRERIILRLRFWDYKSLDEIGTVLGLSKDRIRQIEVRALRKLRWSIYKENKGYASNLNGTINSIGKGAINSIAKPS